MVELPIVPAPPAAPTWSAAPVSRRLPWDAAGGLAFHRLVFARRRSGWWTPLVVGLLGVALYAAMLLTVMLAVVVVTLVAPDVSAGMLRIGTNGVVFDLADPFVMALILGTIALMLPAYVLASLVVNGHGLGLISSAAGRLRWRWLLLCTAVATAIALAVTGLSLLLPEGSGVDGAGVDGAGVVAPGDNPQLWATCVVILLFVPVQAAAEEYVFRGYLAQAIGRWLRHPLFAILLPVPLFVIGHMYDPLGQAGVAAFAVVAGWLTWRTGGLEAAIALHVVNNLLAFLLALAGLSDVNASDQGPIGLAVSVLLIGGFAAIVEVLFRRSGLGRTVILRPVPVP